MKKWIAALLCIALLLGLAACSQPNPQSQGSSDSNNPANDPDVFGMLSLSMNAVVNISYDKDGLVLAATSENELGDEIVRNLSTVLGASCSKVVCDVITAITESAYAQEQNVILLKQTIGSLSPSEAFLEDIQLDAQKVAGKSTVIAAAADTLTDEGYLSLDTAKELLTKQLGLDNTAVEGEPTAQEGLYWFTVNQDDVSSTYSVDANLGIIELLPAEPEMNEDELSGDEFYDPAMDMVPDDTTLFEDFIGDPFENNGDGIIFDNEATADPADDTTEAAA